MLFGRNGERDHVERALRKAASGHSTALVIRGEAGIGKSALVDHAVAMAGDVRVLRGVGIESEAELAFGASPLKRATTMVDVGSVATFVASERGRGITSAQVNISFGACYG